MSPVTQEDKTPPRVHPHPSSRPDTPGSVSGHSLATYNVLIIIISTGNHRYMYITVYTG